jgi:hypothetical protein
MKHTTCNAHHDTTRYIISQSVSLSACQSGSLAVAAAAVVVCRLVVVVSRFASVPRYHPINSSTPPPTHPICLATYYLPVPVPVPHHTSPYAHPPIHPPDLARSHTHAIHTTHLPCLPTTPPTHLLPNSHSFLRPSDITKTLNLIHRFQSLLVPLEYWSIVVLW